MAKVIGNIVQQGVRGSIVESGAYNWAAYWDSRTPSELALTVISGTRIDLDWTNNGNTDYDGVSIERSTDGITYAEIDTGAAGDTSYADNGLTEATHYYYRLRYYRGTHYSAYSNVDSDTTYSYFKITIDTTKAGSANDTFVLPTAGGATVYDYYIDWGEGGAEEHVVVNTNQTHVYTIAGTYQISIRGTFPRIYFNNAGDKLKLLTIAQWGNIV